MFENKIIKVIFSSEADSVFQELIKIANDEGLKGIEGSIHQTLLRSIQRAVELLKSNPFAGNQIPRRLHPKKYYQKYDAENIWRIELAKRWRLIYTIAGNKIEIINFVIDIFNHRDYDSVFGYKH